MKRKISILVSLVMCMQLLFSAIPVFAEDDAETAYTEPESPSVTYNMNVDWKFKKASGTTYPLTPALESVKDASGKQFYELGYDDSSWETVSVPHAPNSEDSFDGLGLDAGEASLFRGFMFYRKNITIPASDAGKKMFLEFEAFRQSVYLYVNGEIVGYYEAGIAPAGFDITDYVKAGEENLIAVATDNSASRGNNNDTKETKPGSEPGAADGVGFQWNTKDFNEVQGGITGNVNLYAKGTIYQTLPLYNNLKTTGNYIFTDNYNLRNNSADIHVEAEVRNESGSAKDITLEVAVVDGEGNLVDTFTGSANVPAATDTNEKIMSVVPSDAYDYKDAERNSVDFSTVQVSKITASKNLSDLNLWSDVSPYLYTVYTYLKDGDTVIDSQKTVTGFRSVEYNKDNGLLINGNSTYLKGYAQRSTNEWAAIGVANDWLSDIDMQLVKESNANYIRWMHIAPNPVDIRAGDKYGVISICPAGDKEGDAAGRSWDQRLEAMRDVIIYFRNSPSILFWEAGNNQITPAHMKAMTDLRKALDPKGGRFMGSRTISSTEQLAEAEWVGTMENRHGTNAYASMKALDKYMPILETEYHRNEAPRRVWDDFSPPYYDYVNKWLGDGASKTDGYDIWDQTQEDFSRTSLGAYVEFYNNRVGASGRNEYTGAAMMVWSDSNMHVRNCGVENARTSGRVDPIRVKKESFYTLQAAQSDTPALHIIGHWNYPAAGDDTYNYEDKTFNGTYWEPNGTILKRDPTKKTVYVVGSGDVAKVELYVNDKLAGTDTTATSNYLYAFDNIDVTQSGKVSAKAYDERDNVIAEDEIKTAGEPARIRLTPVTGPDGLRADGSDLIYVDVEIVDEEGNVCPLDERKINFTVSDPTKANFIGGYNSGYYSDGLSGEGGRIVNHKDYVFAECGINRVFIQSTREAGEFVLTASAEGMQNAQITLSSAPFEVVGGLSTEPQQSFKQGEVPPPPEKAQTPALKALGTAFTADWTDGTGNVVKVNEDTKDYYTVKVNGADVTGFTDKPYRPTGSGVVGEVKTILDAIKAAGADMSYTYTVDGAKPGYMIYGDMPYITIFSGGKKTDIPFGSTNIFENEEVGGLLNFEIAKNSADTDLISELGPVLGTINGVTIETDAEAKVLNITVTPAEASLSSDEDLAALFDYAPAEPITTTERTVELSENLPKVTLVNTDGKVTATSDSDTSAQLIIAGYDNAGMLEAVKLYPLTLTANTPVSVDVDIDIAAAPVSKAMLWNNLTDMVPLADAINVNADSPEQTTEPDETAAPTNTPDETAAPTDQPGSKADGIYEYDTVAASNDGSNVVSGTTAGEGVSWDGTSYLTSAQEADIISIDADSTADIMWSADVRFDQVGSGFSPKNKSNNYGTCVRRQDKDGKSYITVQTGGSSYTYYNEIDPAKWYQVVLIGRYSAPDAKADMIVYEYNGTEKTYIGTYENVNLRNLSANNKSGAKKITAELGTSIDNAKIVMLGADTLQVTSEDDTLKAGNAMPFSYSASRQNAYITAPSVTWALYESDGSTPVTDESITVSSTGLLNAAIDAPSKTILVRATAESGIYAEKAITIKAADISNVKFDTLTLTAEKNYVSADEPLTITASATKNGEAVTLEEGDLIWYASNKADLVKLGDTKWIKIENGVVTVDRKAIAQDITVRAADPTDTVRASLPVHIKAVDALEGNEEGTLDRLITSDNCETELTNTTFNEGAPDGTHYHTATAGIQTGFITETGSDIVVEMDIKFDAEGAGFQPAKNGKINTCVVYHNGQLCVQTGSSKFTNYGEISSDKWYHITLIRKQGAYAHMIFEEYDENGERTNKRLITDVNQRNDEPTAFVNINANTSYDNLRILTPMPDEITVTTDIQSAFLGGTVQANAALFWNELEIKNPDSSVMQYRIYDADDRYPIDNTDITVDGTGLITIGGMAPLGDYYVRAVSAQNPAVYASAKFNVQSADVLTINTLGVSEDEKRLVNLNVTRNFFYEPDYEVTFVTEILGADGTLKNTYVNSLYGESLNSGENTIVLGIDLPSDFNKNNDVIKIYPVSKLSLNDELEPDGSLTASASGNTVTLTAMPQFDEGSEVLVLVTKAGSDDLDVKADDILYFGSSDTQLRCSDSAAGATVKAAGNINGILTVKTCTLN
ncbi:MAG: glycoside hydrolase family 2 TIM barrel-domain containing protein [bacterium]|nr:glycoside hydrolase family 2 TIM barrel-domain containing protein [bacterium]